MTKFETIKQRIKELAKHLDSKTPEEVNSQLWSLAQTSRMSLMPQEERVKMATVASHARRNLGVAFPSNVVKNK